MREKLTRNQIKYIAIIFMLCQHIMIGFAPDTDIWSLTETIIGGITIPIMTYFMCEGYYHTNSVGKYAIRLFIFGLLVQIPYMEYFGAENLNIMFSLLLGLGILWSLNNIDNTILKVIITILFFCLCPLMESMFYIPIFTVTYYICKQKQFNFKLPFIFSALVWFLYNYIAYLIILFRVPTTMEDVKVMIQFRLLITVISAFIKLLCYYLCIPMHKESDRLKGWKYYFSKYFFYLFYPLHLWILYWISI